jgi:hypothetical protein
MRVRIVTTIALALLFLAPTASWAALQPYSQDFEGLMDTTVDENQVALAQDGWKVFVNVFGPDWNYWYGYGPFPAPNGGFGGPAFSAVIVGEGGPAQGDQQLSVYSDYNNGNHRDGSNAIIESNVFQEQIISGADVGTTWRFKFDARRGNIAGASRAGAFFKTINPAAGFALTNYIPIDMTSIPDAWGNYSISIFIDPSLQGQLLQFGFINWASNSEASGIFYDNVSFGLMPLAVGFDIKPGSCPNPLNNVSRGVLPVAVLGAEDFDVTTIDVASLKLEGVDPLRSDLEDVSGPFAAELCGCTASGPDGSLDLTLKFDTQDLMAAIGPYPKGERVLTLTGMLLDGTPIEGKDCVVVIGPSALQPRLGPERERSRMKQIESRPGQRFQSDTLRGR